VLFANLYVFSLIGLVMNIIGDFTYTLVDPRLDFESRAT
jgi:microcin C transport system permease protein